MSDENGESPLPSGNKRRPRILSSSDSDDSDVPIRRVKKCRGALSFRSDSEGSSDSSLVITNRRSNVRPLNDSSSEWSTTSGESDGSDHEGSGSARQGGSVVPNGSTSAGEKSPKRKSPSKDKTSPKAAGNFSDTSDGNSEKCPICLLTFSNQDIGTPETCEHLFCSDCITEWSKNVNTCPVDRLTFSSINVRRKVGGKVIKTVPVNPRISSDEDYIFEDTTFCEVCHLSNSEETMLLCDSCDLGYHMHCLTPPLLEVPENEWFCPSCAANLPRQVLDLVSIPPSVGSLRRVARDASAPSTSGHTSNAGAAAAGHRAGPARSATGAGRRPARRRRRRRTRNVVVEYEIREGEKFPIKTKKRAVRRRRRKATRKAPRTAARRALVRSSVRTRLAEQVHSTAGGDRVPVPLHFRLAVPQLSIYGDRNQLDYFQESDEEDFESGFGRGGAAVAIAPRSLASAILDSQRQVRRKMISIPSPTYASSAPDILSSILESQSLLHCKNGSRAPKKNISDKNTNTPDIAKPISVLPTSNHVDVRKESSSHAKEAPGYPGAGRGSGGGGNGWRGGEGNSGGGGGGRGGGGGPYSGGDYSSFSGEGSAFQGNRPFQSSSPWSNNNTSDIFQRRERYDNYPDRSPMQRGNVNHNNRGRAHQLRYGSQLLSRSLPSWQNQMPPDLSRSFPGENPNYYPSEGGNPVDMTAGHDPGYNAGARTDNYPDIVYCEAQPPGPNPLPPQPPIIRFQKPPLSEDERSDSSLPAETDKYDPTEPTLDDSSSGEESTPRPVSLPQKLTIVSPPRKDPALVADYVSGSDSPGLLKVSSNVLDRAVQQVLKDHKDLISGQKMSTEIDSGGESEGDCPNFSIYSSTSMGIAKSRQEDVVNDEDLVQEDDMECFGNDKSDSDTTLGNIENAIGETCFVSENNDIISSNITDEISESLEPSGDSDTCAPKQTNDEISEDKYSEESDGCENLEPKEKIPETQNDVVNDIEEREGNCLPPGDELSEKENILTNEDNTSFHNSSINIKQDANALKKTPITIKLLSQRSVKNASFSLYDKEDYEDLPSEPESDNAGSTISPIKHKSEEREMDEYANNSSLDEEINEKQLDTSDLLPGDIEKLTESISDAEDERSYTPCLDENKSNKSKDTTFDSEKEVIGIGGLDTEMISEDEGNEIFSDNNVVKTDSDGGALELLIRDTELPQGEFEEGEIVEKRKQKVKEKVKALLNQPSSKIPEDEKKKKKREKRSDKDAKEKSKTKKANEDASFKKLSKSGKERNYRERDDKTKTKNKEKDKRSSRSPDKDKKDKLKDKKRDKRKDIERYDVRNIISDKSRRVKDAFGRDTSRPRSKSQESRQGSPQRFKRSISRRRSLSRGRRSISRGRRSASKIHRSISRGRRSPSRKRQSPIRRRSLSRRRRSVSRARKSLSKNGKSISPRFRRSMSPRFRRSISPRHKVHSPKKRSCSPRGRSPIVRGRRSKSPRARRSVSRIRNKRAKRSPSPRGRRSPRLHRPVPSPRRRPLRRSRSRSIPKNTSVSPEPRKSRKPKRRQSVGKRKHSKSPTKSKPKRKRSGSFSPALHPAGSPSRSGERVEWRPAPEESPLYHEWSSASRSLTPASPGWTPPPPPSNLRVILTTKDKSKKKDKKKKTAKKNKIMERNLQHQPKDAGPSKEVFTSGNNILVSVSFNKNQESENVSTMPPPDDAPRKKKRKTDSTTKAKKDKNKEKSKKKRGVKNKRSKDLENKKPVAIIDLDKSPFKELTPSPKAIIILSDSENGEKEEELMERQEMLRGELMEMGFPQSDDAESPPRNSAPDKVYPATAGPKTPPEPAVKFTIAGKANPQLRVANPLHEEDEEPAAGAEAAGGAVQEEARGPNTPPDPPGSPPGSPDAYDPFEPTKSGSATPERVSPAPASEKPPEPPQIPTMSLEAAQKSNLSADDVIQARPISPMEKVLALLKSTRNNLSPANSALPLYSDQLYDSGKTGDGENTAMEIPTVTVQSPERTGSAKTQTVYPAVVKPNSPKLIYSTVTPTVATSTPGYLSAAPRMGGTYSTATPPPNQRIMLPSPTKSSPLKSQPSKLFVTKPSPIKSTPIKPMPSKTIISKLPMPSIKPMPARNLKGKNGQNGNEVIELDMDMDSPYSPGSSDFGDLFEPPADNGKQSNTYSQNKPGSKFNVFDTLFGGKSNKNSKTSALSKVPIRQNKKAKGKTQGGLRMDEETLKILDDMPSSAVEMQFLKKLNRQERVVEEVKLVLKPHFNKKRISKEDYKDILRRAVPKICHNRSGEINPAKIHTLIEAYVRKFRKKAHQVK